MSYEKVKRHQQFLAEKGQALKESKFDFKRSTNRNKRLIQLNNALTGMLLELNKQTISEMFASPVEEEEKNVKNNITVRFKEAAEVIEKVLTDEGPFIIKSSIGKKTWSEEVSRERMLEFHLEVVMHEIMNIVEEEEENNNEQTNTGNLGTVRMSN